MGDKLKALFFERKEESVSPVFLDAVVAIPGLELERVSGCESMTPGQIAEHMRLADILIVSRTPAVPDELAENPGRLKYICYLHGTMRKVIGLPIIRSAIHVTNWGDRCGPGLAESSLTLLLAVLKDLPQRILAVRNGEGRGIQSVGWSVAGLRVGVYGFGFAGRQFVKRLIPFEAALSVYDPYAKDIPEPCIRVDSLKALFETSQALVIHAGWTPETEGSVTRELLAMLPDHGVVINTARGAIVDQAALFDELRAGRLRAGVDVLWPDDLPPDHEARQWENFIWTCHEFGGSPWPGEEMQTALRPSSVHLDNLRAYVEGKPLQFEIDETRYSLMT